MLSIWDVIPDTTQRRSCIELAAFGLPVAEVTVSFTRLLKVSSKVSILHELKCRLPSVWKVAVLTWLARRIHRIKLGDRLDTALRTLMAIRKDEIGSGLTAGMSNH